MNSKDTENKAEKGVQLNRRITKLEDSLSITKSLLKESKEKNTKRKISKRL